MNIYFVGIKGTGMAALVEIFFHNGAIITGSDVSERFYTDEVLEPIQKYRREMYSSDGKNLL